MLAHPTLEKLYSLRLWGMARGWEEQMRMTDLRELTFEERFGLLVDGRYGKVLAGLARMDLLLIDDWGLVPLDDHGRRDILEILEDRHDVRSTIVTGQLPVSGWHEMIGDPTLADAILDRLVHNAGPIPATQVHKSCPASLRSDTWPPSFGMGGRNRRNTQLVAAKPFVAHRSFLLLRLDHRRVDIQGIVRRPGPLPDRSGDLLIHGPHRPKPA